MLLYGAIIRRPSTLTRIKRRSQERKWHKATIWTQDSSPVFRREDPRSSTFAANHPVPVQRMRFATTCTTGILELSKVWFQWVWLAPTTSTEFPTTWCFRSLLTYSLADILTSATMHWTSFRKQNWKHHGPSCLKNAKLLWIIDWINSKWAVWSSVTSKYPLQLKPLSAAFLSA